MSFSDFLTSRLSIVGILNNKFPKMRVMLPFVFLVDISVFARSALSIRAVHLILLSGLRPSVTEIIDFYEGEQKAASSLLSTGTLSS